MSNENASAQYALTVVCSGHLANVFQRAMLQNKANPVKLCVLWSAFSSIFQKPTTTTCLTTTPRKALQMT